MKIGFVGCGFVGASSVYACLFNGLGTDYVLVDVNHDLAIAQAEDLSHAAPFAAPVRIHAGTYDDLSDAGIVVIAAGVNQKEGETRLDLLKRNTDIFESIVPEILNKNKNTIFVIATNPVDIMTQVTADIIARHDDNNSGVLGTGTILDTARFRTLLGQHLSIAPQSVHAYVLGEHGDSEVMHWSGAQIGNLSMENFSAQIQAPLTENIKSQIDEKVRRAAYHIIKGKGATYYGIGAGVARIVDAIIHDQNTILTCAAPVKYFDDLNTVTFSLPQIVGKSGITETLYPELNQGEHDALKHSAEILLEAYESLL